MAAHPGRRARGAGPATGASADRPPGCRRLRRCDDDPRPGRLERARQARARLEPRLPQLARGLSRGARLSLRWAYLRTTRTTPAASSTSPTMRDAPICCLATPSSPRRSITTEIVSWPAITTAVRPLTPSVRTASSATNTYTAPNRPPIKAHHGTRPMCPRLASPPRRTTAISTSAAVPTRKEKVAACTPPTVLPKRELTGACMPTRQPAPTPSSTARPRLTRAAPSRSLRLQPVLADADVDGQRRIAIPHAAHLARDQLTRGVGLRRRPLEQQLVVDREDQARA